MNFQYVNFAKAYNPYIDSVRALAVGLVFLHHLFPSWLPGGYIGVDVFFVISGYVITQSLLNKYSKNKCFIEVLKQFYSQRIKRIFPLVLCVFVLSTIILSFLRDNVSFDLEVGKYALLGLGNIPLYFNELDYWGTDVSQNIFMHTWSLGIEEQFYLIYPFLLLIALKNQLSGIAIILAAFIVSLALYLFNDLNDDPSVYFNTAYRFWEISAGCLLYLLKINFLAKAKNTNYVISILVLAILCLSIQSILSAQLTIFFSVVFTFILLGVLSIERKINYFFKSDILGWIGKRSFSIYMWHWPFIVIARIILPESVYQQLFVVIITLTVAHLSYKYLEVPVRYSHFNSRGVVFYFCSSILVAIFLISSVKNDNYMYSGDAEVKNLKISNIQKELSCDFDLQNNNVVRILGNSHSLMFRPAVDVLAKKCGFVVKTHKQYPKNVNSLLPYGYIQNTEKIKRDIDKIFDDKNLKVIVLASRYKGIYKQPFLDGKGERWHTSNGEKYNLNRFFSELDYMIKQATKNNVRIIFLMPLIESNSKLGIFSSDRCAKQWFQLSKPLEKDCSAILDQRWMRERFDESFYSRLEKFAQEYVYFDIMDGNQTLCPDPSSCSRILEGYNLLLDTNHISENAALLLSRDLNTILERKIMN